MFIQTQETPNPNTMKFLPGTTVMVEGTLNFIRGDDCIISPLAQHLMQIDGVHGVFLGADFISVTKKDDSSWDNLRTIVLAAIIDHYMAGYPAVLDSNAKKSKVSPSHENNNRSDMDLAIIEQIKEIIETRVRPAVAEDGGDIIFHDFIEGIVYLEMHGACSGCPSSTITLKAGIENMLKHYIPEIHSVQAI